MGSTRRTCRVESCRVEPSGIWALTANLTALKVRGTAITQLITFSRYTVVQKTLTLYILQRIHQTLFTVIWLNVIPDNISTTVNVVITQIIM